MRIFQYFPVPYSTNLHRAKIDFLQTYIFRLGTPYIDLHSTHRCLVPRDPHIDKTDPSPSVTREDRE